MPAATSIPDSTYRFQFNGDFTFRQATALLDYLQELGISHVYSSPFFQASEGSTHGYDVANHNRLNPDVGTPGEYAEFIAGIRQRGMGHLLDFVPNHMGISEPVNQWWMDVLENGQSSLYSGYFDIEWHPPKEELENKVLLPILGDRYGKVLENQEFRLDYRQGGFFLRYHESLIPLNPRSYPRILNRVAARMPGSVSQAIRDEWLSISNAFAQLPYSASAQPDCVQLRAREKEIGKRRLAQVLTSEPVLGGIVEETLRELEGTIGQPASFDALHELLDAQSYRLAHWRVAAEEINYRRFFDITSLAAIRCELPEVFDASHALVLKMIERGEVTGLRIDHIDGLWDPRSYLEQLQQKVAAQGHAGSLYLIVEKILGPGEYLPDDWPVAGTTGYDFVADTARLFVDPAAAESITQTYATFGGWQSYEDIVYDRKILVTRMALTSEIASLGQQLDRYSEKNRNNRDFTLNQLTAAVRETIACFPVYRTYILPDRPVREEDRRIVQQAVREARRRNPSIDKVIFQYLARVLLMDRSDADDATAREDHIRFVMKFQQISGPVMAKGVEDTSFYVYNRLVALNDVGGEPGQFGFSVPEFHASCVGRLQHSPNTLLATSTHDTKRSEDVRNRIAVISELPAEWRAGLDHWRQLNTPLKSVIDGKKAPAPNEEYLLYQILAGAWPLEKLNDRTRPGFVRRIQDYMTKALKEAKINSSWVDANEDWENATSEFVAALLDPARSAEFLESFAEFARRISESGAINSLSQTVLKCTTPGIPDIYQGSEIWDFSLVDPDNRRPVDYDLRRKLLASIASASAEELLNDWPSGRVKLFVLQTLLRFGQQKAGLFRNGTYQPLATAGADADKIVAFRRSHNGDTLIVVVPRFTATLPFPPVGNCWSDTSITLPEGSWTNLFTGAIHNDSGKTLVHSLLKIFPVACLVPQSKS